MSRHLFAFYLEKLSDLVSTIPQQLLIKDAELIVRMIKVVRLKVGDGCILFNTYHHAQGYIRPYA